MNETERIEFFEIVDRQSADIVPVILEAFRIQADEHNLDPIAGVYVSAKVFIFLASYCAHLMIDNGFERDDVKDLVMSSIDAMKVEIALVMKMMANDENTPDEHSGKTTA